MTVQITDGCLIGALPDDTGREWPVVQHRQNSARGPLKAGTHNLVMHTTETDGYVETLRFPSQWQCGEGKIGQHIRLGLAGDSVNTWDLVCQQIEMVGRSQLQRWLPEEQTLGPTVALVAWLHTTERIKTGLRRPALWPVMVDTPIGSGLPASSLYYRRRQNLWPDVPGVYGHLEIPDNSHWDPGGFDYPRFFARVQAAIEGGDMSEWTDGNKAYREAFAKKGSDPGAPPDGKPAQWRDGWAAARFPFRNIDPTQPGPHEHALQGKAT
jgi:hypothetical protein